MENSGFVYRHRATAEEAGTTVLALYLARFTHTDEATWRERIREGRVKIGEKVVSADTVVAAGDELTFHRAPWVEPEAPCRFDVVFEDEHVLAVEKPAGLQVLPGGPFTASTLWTLVRSSAPDRAEAAPAHRLGRGTSGLVVFGKTFVGRAALSKQFREFVPRKTYLAIADEPEHAPRDFALPASARHPIGDVQHGPIRIWIAREGGKPAHTRLRVVARDRERRRLLVAAQPITGRADQIRIHLAACGAPITGDPLFGVGGVPKSDVTPGAGGYHLHATALAVLHPVDGRWIRLRSRPPWPGLERFACVVRRTLD